MECNRDQSDDCYNMAIKFLRDGNTERAVHFLEKSIKLYPNPRAQHLLSQIQAEQQQQNQHQQSQSFDENTNTDSFSSSGSGSNSSSSSRTQSRQSASTPVDTSDIEDPDIKRILEAGDDYYMVFDLPKTATIVEIKKRYRKLAIKTHPDKSTSKGAEEAFKSKIYIYMCKEGGECESITSFICFCCFCYYVLTVTLFVCHV